MDSENLIGQKTKARDFSGGVRAAIKRAMNKKRRRDSTFNIIQGVMLSTLMMDVQEKSVLSGFTSQ